MLHPGVVSSSSSGFLRLDVRVRVTGPVNGVVKTTLMMADGKIVL